jgi:hypothetical protein
MDEVEKFEVNRKDCFLCSPNTNLIYEEIDNAFLMAGLGSIVAGYSIVATREHIRYLSELSEKHYIQFIEFLIQSRKRLIGKYGSCLLTEHGKMPMCDSEASEHCYHPHFLMFPSAPDIVEVAKSSFESYRCYDNIRDALDYGLQLSEYCLISPSEEKHFIFNCSNSLPKQYLRMLVAEAYGRAGSANWREIPNIAEAHQTVRTMAK